MRFSCEEKAHIIHVHIHIYCTRITFHSISRTIFLLPYFAGNPTQYPIDSVPTSRGFFFLLHTFNILVRAKPIILRYINFTAT